MYRLLPALFFALMLPAQAAERAGITEAMATRANDLIAVARQSDLAFDIVESLTTEVGPRLAGTGSEERARHWAVATLERLGFSNVRVEPFQLPVWERGLERAEVTDPFPQPLAISTLGGSIGTGPQGVEGKVVSFTTLAALEGAARSGVEGRIVFLDEPTVRTQDGLGYGMGSVKRRKAAYIAEELGAMALLIRSVGTSSHRFAHTGQMRRVTDTGAGKGVPAAALSAPDSDQLQRMLLRGDVTVRMTLTPELRPAGQSGNVIAEIPGRGRPEEIVLVSAHLDSWDLGTGAVDDGAGVGIVVAAAKQILDAFPRGLNRTVRVVLFGAEEVGLVGARAYADRHEEQLPSHIVAAESDFGAGRIWRFDTRFGSEKVSLARAMGTILAPLGVGPGSNSARGGPDMTFLREAGVPVVSLVQNGWDYFDLHHTADDTLDKIDPHDLRQNVAVYTAFLYLAGELMEDFR